MQFSARTRFKAVYRLVRLGIKVVPINGITTSIIEAAISCSLNKGSLKATTPKWCTKTCYAPRKKYKFESIRVHNSGDF